MPRSATQPHPDAQPMLERYYSAEEIALHMGLSKDTILGAIKRGEIEGAVKPFENVLRVPASEVNAWLDRAKIARRSRKAA